MHRFDSFILSLMKFLVLSVFAVTPIFFLPLLTNFYDTAKLVVLAFFACLLLLLWSIRTALTRTIGFSFYPRVLTALGLFLSVSVSTLIISPNKFEALVSHAGTATFFCVFVIIFISSMIADEQFRRELTWALIGSASLAALVSVYMFFGIGLLMFPDAEFMKNPSWTPVGSSLAAIAFLVTITPLAIFETVRGFREKNDLVIALGLVSGTLLTAASVLTAIRVLPTLSASILPLSASWSIMLDVYKNLKFALFGVGPENFLGAFTSARPTALNAGPLWNSRFLFSGTAFLHLGTIAGLLGITAMLTLLRTLASSARTAENAGLKAALVLAIIFLLISPYHIAYITAVFALLLLVKNYESVSTHTWKIPDHIGWVAYTFAVIGFTAAGIFSYMTGRYFLSETTFKKSLDAARVNDGGLTYNLQINSIKLNPYNTSFRIAYAQTNFALANSIASSIQATASGQQVALSENDRNTISQLIQQAIREAKIAAQLGPDNIYSWETLARTYSSITNIVQGADQWAIAAYQRAIQLDPTNSVHRLNLAGIYINRNDLDNAIIQLQAALVLKPDAAITYYNLAYVFSLRKEYAKQAAALKQTLALLPKGSADANRVTEELEKVKENLTPEELMAFEGKTPQGTTNQLPLPAANPTPELEITPKLELPEEASTSVEPQSEPARP